MGFYEDVLAAPESEESVNDQASGEAEEKAIAELRAQEDLAIIGELENRLCATEEGEVGSNQLPYEPTYSRVLHRAGEIISRAEAARKRANPEASSQPLVPIGVLSAREYETLVRASVRDFCFFLFHD